jgi:pimeloyl-ACP methyl ester carboxylesterase
VAEVAAPLEGSTRVDEAVVHWRRQGSGPALVFLHGFPLSGETWDAVAARLRDRFTCWAPDLIGLGRSHSPLDQDYASPGQARAMSGLLADIGVDSYALVGNDTGGWIARELALLDGKRVSHLVLTNTEIPFHRPPWIPTHQTLAHAPGAAAVFGQLLKLRAFRHSPLAFGGCFWDASLIDGSFHRRFVEPLIASRERMDGAMRFLRQMKFSRLDEFRSLHARLTMPVLFVWGAEDPTFPEARARGMLGEFPNVAGFHGVPKAKLFVQEERPEEVAARIDAFLPGSTGRPPG